MPGDKGVVIRRYAARLGGVEQTSPSLSILCDKLELSTPAGLRSLSAVDYVDMSLELLVLPRAGDWDMALRNMYAAREDARATGSVTYPALDRPARLTLRDQLFGIRTSERVEAQARGGELRVTATSGARVESHYPIRVAATAEGRVMFEVEPMDATPIAAAMGDWCKGGRKGDDTWCCASSCGACRQEGCVERGDERPKLGVGRSREVALTDEQEEPVRAATDRPL